jgi:hypothetical protein
VGLERRPLSLKSTIVELFEIKGSRSGPQNREYGRRDPSRCQYGTLYPQKLALASPTGGERSVSKFSRGLGQRSLVSVKIITLPLRK